MKLKGLLLTIFLILAAAGCAKPVRSDLSAQYSAIRPYRIAVLPVIPETRTLENDAAWLMRKLSFERLRSMGYQPIDLEVIDEEYSKLGTGWFAGKKPADVAEHFGADSVLYIRVNEWDRDTFVTYISLDISAEFEVWSANNSRLWRAQYSKSEGDIRLDRESLKLALLKAYEPRIERFVDTVFSTLPQAEAPQEAKRTFFQWLP